MAHEIEKDRAFFVGEKPWHSQGFVLDKEPSTEFAIRCMMSDDPTNKDTDCNVYDMPLVVPIQNEDGTFEYIPSTSHKAIMRSDKSIVGIVGADRETLQPVEQFQFFEPFRESGLVVLESGMSLRNGSQLILTAKLRDGMFEVVPNDAIKNYLMFAISFDSSLPQLIKFHSTRVVCANTLQAAQDEKNKNGTWKNRHTKNVRNRIQAVQQTIQEALEMVKNTQEAYQYLARKKANHAEQTAYVHQVFEFDPTDQDNSTRLTNKVQSVIDLLDTQRGLEELPAIRGTMWQAYNAVTQHLTYDAGRNDSTRLQSNLFGANSLTNRRALDLALNA